MSQPRIGAHFGRYRIDSQLGMGGMGVVFRATDLRLHRQVALKINSKGPFWIELAISRGARS